MTSKTIYMPISARVIAKFKPTRLYIKRHSVTGLLYLGKTTAVGKKFDYYLGGGAAWNLHLKEFGRYVETLWISKVYTIDMIYELRDTALALSKKRDIINSIKWANKYVENGLSGSGAGAKFTQEQNANRAAVRAANKAAGLHSSKPHGSLGKKHTQEQSDARAGTRAANKAAGLHSSKPHGNIGKVRTPETRAKMSDGKRGIPKTPEHIANNVAARKAGTKVNGNRGRKHTPERLENIRIGKATAKLARSLAAESTPESWFRT